MEWRGRCDEAREESWGEVEFRGIERGDRRLEQRVPRLAADLAARPQASLTQASEDWAATKAADRLFANAKVAAEKVLGAPRTNTVHRMKPQRLVLAIQATTSLNYRAPRQTTGLGPIGDSQSAASGLMMHSTLVVTAAGLPLGLLRHELWVRAGDKKQSSRERKHTAIEEKESYRWLMAWQQTAAETPESTTVLALCDREADIYEFLVEAHRLGAKVVVRAAWERHMGHAGYPRRWPLVETRSLAGSLLLEVAARARRRARQARLAVRFTAVTIDPPRRHRRAVPEPLPALTLYAVQVKGVAPPPGEEAIEGMLLTNLPVRTLRHARRCVAW